MADRPQEGGVILGISSADDQYTFDDRVELRRLGSRYDFLRALHPSGYRNLRALRDGEGSRTENTAADDLTAVNEFADRHREHNIYVGVATRAAKGADVRSCDALYALFAELDFKDVAEDRARARLAEFALPPSMIVGSGGGLHAYWLLDEPLDLQNGGAARAGRLLRGLAGVLGADQKSAEPARILRLPGTLNHKYDPPREVTLELFEADRRYPLSEFPSFHDDDETETKEPLPSVVSDGGRNNTLFREGSRLRRLGFQESEILAALTAVNDERCRPPLDAREVETIARSCAKYEPQADTYPTTETGDAEFFVACNQDRVRYDHRVTTWLTFDNHAWVPQTDGQVYRLALETVRARQAATLTIKDDAVRRKERFKWAIGGEARKRQANLLAIAENLKPVADAGNEWDTDPWLLCVQNGVIDLRTGKLREGRPDDRITKVAPVRYDSHAKAERWERFVPEVFRTHPELADYVQRALGYSLTGIITEQVFWVLWGAGSNGKSTLIETFARHVMGLDSHAWTMPFPTAGWANAMTEYQKAKLAGRRLVLSSEVEVRGRLNETLVKSLTGDDVINGRNPYGQPFQFIPAAKFWTRVNHKPIIRDQSHAMWRRVKLIPFIETFTVDTQLPAALQAEASGILTWAVKGCLDWQRHGLQEPQVITDATNAYRNESRPIHEFFDDRCVFEQGASVRAMALYNAYEAWREARRIPEVEWLNQRSFGEQVANDGRITVEKKRTPRGTWYVGIRLLGDEAGPNAAEFDDDLPM